MTSTSNKSESGKISTELNVEKSKPIWNHITKLGRSSKGERNVAFKCNYYNVAYKISYSRVKARLRTMIIELKFA